LTTLSFDSGFLLNPLMQLETRYIVTEKVVKMTKEKERELKKAEWCFCPIHNITYPCSEGCPKCK